MVPWQSLDGRGMVDRHRNGLGAAGEHSRREVVGSVQLARATA